MLDSDFIQRAAPSGSMRYFALLYTPELHRELMAALFVLENEIRASARATHEVAHTRMQWWRGEIDRLTNRNAQHPATKVLQAALPGADFSLLHELLAAADMDLARMTYHTEAELNSYLSRSGGTIFSLAAEGSQRAAAKQLGALIRRVETLRDLHADLRSGRIFWPLDELTSKNIVPERILDEAAREPLKALVATETERLIQSIEGFTALHGYILARPLNVLLKLHGRLAKRIARENYEVFTKRHEPGALEKNFTAWRAARVS